MIFDPPLVKVEITIWKRVYDNGYETYQWLIEDKLVSQRKIEITTGLGELFNQISIVLGKLLCKVKIDA